MSYQDDFSELEKRLRQSKPQAEPFPPVLKRQMRQELMEQMTMNESRFSFRKLSMALGGLILLIGIPVFFWLAQMSIGTADVPGSSGPDQVPTELDPNRPTPTVAVDIEADAVEVPVVELPEDKAWVISTDIPQGETVGRNETINVTIGYELVNVTEAELVLKLLDGPRGVLTVNKIVEGANGTAVIPISLTDLEEVSGASVELGLNLFLRDLDSNAEKLLYLDFVEGWTVDLTAEPPATTAEIVEISTPTAVEEEGLPVGAVYDVELVTAYTLSDYEDGVLVVGFDYQGANGSAGGYDVHAIQMGTGEITARLRLDSSLINDAGELVDGLNFFVRINRYDESLAQWVNVYPGDIVLEAGEQNLPYPYIVDTLFVQSAAWNENEAGQTVLNVTMRYNLVSQPSSEIQINLTDDGETLLASETAAIEAGDGSVTVPIIVDQSLLSENTSVQVTAVLTAGEYEIQDEQAVIYQSQAAIENQGNLWIVSTDVVTRTTENGVGVNITLVIGYDLSGEYSGGSIAFSTQYASSNNSGGGGGGGGGGSQAELTPGIGTTQFEFGFETTSWADAQDWLNSISTNLRLFGHTASGEDVLIGELDKIGTD